MLCSTPMHHHTTSTITTSALSCAVLAECGLLPLRLLCTPLSGSCLAAFGACLQCQGAYLCVNAPVRSLAPSELLVWC